MNETLPDLKKESAAASPDVVLGFGNAAGFAMLQRAASLLANSTLVPEAYRKWIKDKDDKYGQLKENDAAISNCVIALNMAQRLEADPIMIMQNLYVVEGRPSWSSQFIIAALNTTGRFSPLRFKISEPMKKTVEVTMVSWVNKQRQVKKESIEIQDRTCIAWAIEKETGERLESPPVSIEMAAKEGWLTKKGSKWQTMPDLMLRYRAATLFGRLYAPEKLMGLQTEEESRDIYDLEPANGGFSLPEATPADHTADILKRAQGQEEQPAVGKRQALRDEARAAVLEAGLNLEDVEKAVNGYWAKWTAEQCRQAVKMAEAATQEASNDAASEPETPEETATQDDATRSIPCPKRTSYSDDGEEFTPEVMSTLCDTCDQRDGCPSWEGA